ncbi:hypothetical protein PVAP13_3KG517501 [Panicum virgatum]|uniref:Uncharacterized protein n=1 Tax=Panicum virgatum TaxID=38727 RepID=A0A8T0V0T4_PANVG|nr:hypothetical protein PVAP13_3KG517501 [Panicum virgatum]
MPTGWRELSRRLQGGERHPQTPRRKHRMSGTAFALRPCTAAGIGVLPAPNLPRPSIADGEPMSRPHRAGDPGEVVSAAPDPRPPTRNRERWGEAGVAAWRGAPTQICGRRKEGPPHHRPSSSVGATVGDCPRKHRGATPSWWRGRVSAAWRAAVTATWVPAQICGRRGCGGDAAAAEQPADQPHEELQRAMAAVAPRPRRGGVVA